MLILVHFWKKLPNNFYHIESKLSLILSIAAAIVCYHIDSVLVDIHLIFLLLLLFFVITFSSFMLITISTDFRYGMALVINSFKVVELCLVSFSSNLGYTYAHS